MVELSIATSGINETLNEIVARIVEKYQPEKIILFGSFAYGIPDPDSDIDLLIIKQTKERPIDRRIRVRHLLRPLKAGLPISPIVVTSDEIKDRLEMGDQFAQEIVSQGFVLYERN